jgi:hypothetical protein
MPTPQTLHHCERRFDVAYSINRNPETRERAAVQPQSERKEVTTVKYEKPELVQRAHAMKVVRHPDDKNDPERLDNPQELYGSIAAYAADE